VDDAASPVRQVLRCARLLREGWHTKGELAERLSVSERTVRRYLAAIGEEEPLATRELDERGLRAFRIAPRFHGRDPVASRHEVFALSIAERVFRAFDPGGVADLLDQVLLERLGDGDRGAALRRDLGRRFVLARGFQPLPGDVRLAFDLLLRALVEGRAVELRYASRRGRNRSYVLRPYTLLLGERELAIVGAIGLPDATGAGRRVDAIRTFALHAIRSISLTETRFLYPDIAHWDPEARYAAAWGLYAGRAERVEVAIHPAFADVAEGRRFHASQERLPAASDGWLRLAFTVFPDGEFRTWLLGWGPYLRVLSPDRLAAWVDRRVGPAEGRPEPEEDEVFRIP
jgi:predicted DNA-binding transcriptional regulator YafY